MRAIAVLFVIGLLGLAACAAPSNEETFKLDRPAQTDAPRLPPRPTPDVDVTPIDADGPPPQETSALIPPPPYASWSAMVMAGDNRANTGNMTRAFDNARRDVAAQILAWGFETDAVRQYSVTPDAFPGEPVRRTTLAGFRKELARLKLGTGRGCFFYITSHGTREGVTFNTNVLRPDVFWTTVDRLCGRQPVIAIVSACHSGVFAEPQWQAPNRFILTAARADRTSFGCGEDNVYPYFDACFLEAAGTAGTWPALAEATRACVDRRERADELTPSEPQLFIGDAIRAKMGDWKLEAGSAT